MLTTAEIADRSARAVAAATAAGRQLGLTVAEPRVLHDLFSVIVHLAPSPVVVRVPTVAPHTLLRDVTMQTQQQRRELAVAGWLADRGFPVVPPSPLVPRKPVQREGFSMTFWQFVEQHAAAEPDYLARCARLPELHAAMRDYPGAGLGFWRPLRTCIDDGLTVLAAHPELLAPADLVRANQEWAVLRPALSSSEAFEKRFPDIAVQPIHGDAPFYNMIATPDGDMWSDFELVTGGPVESDLSMVGPDGVAAYDDAAAEVGLRRTDPEVLRFILAAGNLAGVATLAMALQLPMLVDALAPSIDSWRETAPVTTL